MVKFLKRALGRLVKEYAIYRIYSSSNDCRSSASASPSVRVDVIADAVKFSESSLEVFADYGGEQAVGFGAWQGSCLVGVCFYWYGDRYRARNFWPLREREAKLVQIVTAPEWRGRGVATALIRDSSEVMASRGFERLYARVWHSNKASCRAFERAGWRCIGFVTEVLFFGGEKPFRWESQNRVIVRLLAGGGRRNSGEATPPKGSE